MSRENEKKDSEFSRLPPFDNALSQDEKALKLFADRIQFKVDMKEFSAITDKERKILRDAVFYPGIFVGAAFGLASFITFRRAPVYMLNRIQARQHAESFARAKKGSSSSSIKEKTLAEIPPLPKYREGPIVRVVGTIVDALFSFAVGMVAWTIVGDKNKLLTAAADIPLVEGKSAISDDLCDDFIHIYRDKVPKNFWDEKLDDNLIAVKRFVTNCDKRRLYERKLRRERGLSSNDDIVLPSPVSDDVVREEEDRYGGADWAALDDFDEE